MRSKPETHDVMVRPSIDIYAKLTAIAAIERRSNGPQALKFVEEGINRYLAEHPCLAEQIESQSQA